jgi:hypothetical protein
MLKLEEDAAGLLIPYSETETKSIVTNTSSLFFAVWRPLHLRPPRAENDGRSRSQGKQFDPRRTFEPGIRRRGLHCELH